MDCRADRRARLCGGLRLVCVGHLCSQGSGRADRRARLCSGLYLWIVEGLCCKIAKRHLALGSRFHYVLRRGAPKCVSQSIKYNIEDCVWWCRSCDDDFLSITFSRCRQELRDCRQQHHVLRQEHRSISRTVCWCRSYNGRLLFSFQQKLQLVLCDSAACIFFS